MFATTPRCCVLVFALLGLFTLGVAEPATAGNVPLVSDVARVNNVATWEFEADFSGVEGHAYRSVRLRVRSLLGAVTTEQRFEYELLVNRSHRDTCDEGVRATLVLPPGATEATVLIDAPQRAQWRHCSLVVNQVGEPPVTLEWYSPNGTGGVLPHRLISVLVIDNDFPSAVEIDRWRTNFSAKGSPFADKTSIINVRSLLTIFPEQENFRNVVSIDSDYSLASDADLLASLEENPDLCYVNLASLSPRWLSLSNASLVLIDFRDLQTLQQQRPECLEALARYCLTGRTLVVGGLSDAQELASLNELLAAAGAAEPVIAWQSPEQNNWSPKLKGIDYSKLERGNSRSASGFTWDAPTAPPDTPPFRFRKFGFGHVVAWMGNTPFPDDMHHWGWVLNSLELSRLLWERQQGMSHAVTNNDYWNLLIPGIGQAPVYSFMGLIGLFMLIIGPLNYYLLQRTRRLAWLLITVPAGAALFTTGLVLFALLSDGFTTRARIRSFTILEGGRAASQSRHNYFATIIPSAGLLLPPDTAIYPYHFEPSEQAHDYGYVRYNNRSSWNDDWLTLRSGYLATREQRQFMLERASSTPARLKIRSAVAEGVVTPGKIVVENRLGVLIKQLAVIDALGQRFVLHNLRDGERAETEVLAGEEGQLIGNQWQLTARLYEPAAFERVPTTRPNRRRWSYGIDQRTAGLVIQSESLLEKHWLELLGAGFPRRSDSTTLQTREQPRWYAIVEEPLRDHDGHALVPLVHPSAQLQATTHAVMGTW
jgi:hypothetical protein